MPPGSARRGAESRLGPDHQLSSLCGCTASRCPIFGIGLQVAIGAYESCDEGFGFDRIPRGPPQRARCCCRAFAPAATWPASPAFHNCCSAALPCSPELTSSSNRRRASPALPPAPIPPASEADRRRVEPESVPTCGPSISSPVGAEDFFQRGKQDVAQRPLPPRPILRSVRDSSGPRRPVEFRAIPRRAAISPCFPGTTTRDARARGRHGTGGHCR